MVLSPCKIRIKEVCSYIYKATLFETKYVDIAFKYHVRYIFGDQLNTAKYSSGINWILSRHV